MRRKLPGTANREDDIGKMKENNTTCDLLVIGAGAAGTAAALFAGKKGISTAIVGIASHLRFASGLMDLMDTHRTMGPFSQNAPWTAVQAIRTELPEHPYAKLPMETVRLALSQYLSILEDEGLTYHCRSHENVQVITSAGTLKTTYAVPAGMWPMDAVLRQPHPFLVVDIKGLKGFSAKQIMNTLGPHHPCKAFSVDISQASGDFPAEQIARMFEQGDIRDHVVSLIRPNLQGMAAVGFPSVLGVCNSETVRLSMAEKLGVPVFEIPTIPPSIPGQRLETALVNQMNKQGVQAFLQEKVLSVDRVSNRGFECVVGRLHPQTTIRSRGVILATGRFFGKGLMADRKGLREAVFNLPVLQPEDRKLWHNKHFLEEHAINQAGLETDGDFRPLASDGQPAHPALFATGSILAHNDWMRKKCGMGVSIATAYAAVSSFERAMMVKEQPIEIG